MDIESESPSPPAGPGAGRTSGAPAHRPILPRTRLGRAAAWLMLAFLAWMLGLNPLVMAGEEDIESLRLAVVAFGLAGMTTGLASAATALVAILRRGERSVVAFACLLPGAFVILFVLGEALAPH